MKKLALTFFSVLLSVAVFAGWTSHSTSFDGKTRKYKIYTPLNQSPNAKIVVLLHGLGGTMNDFDFTSWPVIADSANIVLISPQGLPFSSILGTIEGVFNSGMKLTGTPLGDIEVNGDINDVGFVSSLLDTAIAQFSIDQNRIYVTGFSNGGFMTQRLAGELTGRIAAVASVGGTRSAALPPLAAGTRLPVAHFHGDADSVVRWDGYVATGAIGAYLGISVDSLISLWISSNQLSSTPNEDTLGSASAPFFMTRQAYHTGGGASLVELFRIHNGVHTWYNYNTTGNGFDIAHESWKFFSRFNQTGVSVREFASQGEFVVSPNPVGEHIQLKGELSKIQHARLFDLSGKQVRAYTSNFQAMPLPQLSSGMYFLKVQLKDGRSLTIKLAK